MSTKQLYLVIRLPGGSSTTVPLPISSQLSIRLPFSSSTSVPLPKVVDLKPKSSTHVLSTIIGLAKLKYLYSWHMLQNMQIYRYTKQARISNKTHRKINEYFYSWFTSQNMQYLRSKANED